MTSAKRQVFSASEADGGRNSSVVTAGGWVFASAQLPSDEEGRLHPEAVPDPRSPFTSHVVELQTDRILENLKSALARARSTLASDLMRIYWWLVSDRPDLDDFKAGSLWSNFPDIAPIHDVRDEELADPQPATTGIGVRGHLIPGAILAVEAIGLAPLEAEKVSPAVASERGGDWDGRASVVRWGDWVFATAVPTDWAGDFMAEKRMGEPSILAPQARSNPYFWMHADVERQVDYTLEHLQEGLAQVGSSLERCFRAEVYIGHPQALYELDRAWRRWFPENPPARVVVPYAGLGGKGWQVEIGLQALADDSSLERECIETSDAPEPFLHEPQAVRVGELCFLSTQLAVDSFGRVPEHVLPDPDRPFEREVAALQADFVIENVSRICGAAGGSLEGLCRRQALYTDLAHSAPVNRIWGGCFSAGPPASSDIQMARPGWPYLVPNALFSFDLIGHCAASGGRE